MKLSKIKIDNYRSINSVEVTVNDSIALVGANSVGKSCILSAINRALGETYYYRINKSDFHKENVNEPIKIFITFSELTDEERTYFHAVSRAYCRKRGALPKSYRRDGATGPWISNTSENLSVCLELSYEEDSSFYYVGDDYDPIRWGNVASGDPVKVKRDDKKYFPKVISIPSHRDPIKFFSGSTKSVWMTLMEDLKEKIRSDSAVSQPLIDAVNAVKATPHFISLSNKLQTQILDFLTTDHSSVTASILPIDPSDILKAASLFINDGYDCSLDLKGDGVKSLAVVAILLLAASERHYIICFEEPELYLHPTALFILNKTIQKKDGSQIIYATHSPFLINVTKPKNIVRVYKQNGTTLIKQLTNKSHWLTKEGELEIERDIDAQRNMVFFARGVILVEGPTENLALPYFAKIMAVDLDKMGVVLIEVNGKGNLKRYSEYLADFLIPHIVVYDYDKPGDPLTEIIQTELPNAIPMKDDFESMLVNDLGEGAVDRLLSVAYGEMYTKYKNHHLIQDKPLSDQVLGFLIKNKPFSARYLAENMTSEDDVPKSIKTILAAANNLLSN